MPRGTGACHSCQTLVVAFMPGRYLLFRYRSLDGQSSEYTKCIIFESRLYFANPLSFNDPFDRRPVFKLQASNDQIKDLLRWRPEAASSAFESAGKTRRIQTSRDRPGSEAHES